MYIDRNHIIVIYIITILLLIIPLILSASQIKLFRNLNFSNFVKVLNKGIIPQLIIGVIMTIVGIILDKVFYSDGKGGNSFSEIFIESTYCYIVIGSFFYLPAIGLINIIKLIINRLNKKSTSR
jgi:hypothetical protein